MLALLVVVGFHIFLRDSLQLNFSVTQRVGIEHSLQLESFPQLTSISFVYVLLFFWTSIFKRSPLELSETMLKS